MHHGNHIDDMTKKWQIQTPNPPRIPQFYILTKIHKPIITYRPITSGCDGPTEKISSFVDTLLQPLPIWQESYEEDTTDFIRFIEKTRTKNRTLLATMDVASLSTSILHDRVSIQYAKHTTIFIKRHSHTNILSPRISSNLMERITSLPLPCVKKWLSTLTCLFSFSNFRFGFQGFHLKTLKIIMIF